MESSPEIDRLRQELANAEGAENWNEVDRLCGELSSLVERDAAFTARHAIAVLKTGAAGRAATMMRRAIRLDPDEPNHRLELGKIYFAQNRRDEAEKTFRELLKIAPDHVEGLRRLAQAIQIEEAHREEAEELLNRAAELEPDNVAVWQQLGAIYGNDTNRYEDAENAFRHALEIKPALPSAYHNIGLLRRFQGDLETAETYLRKACELSPHESGFAFSLGSCLMYKEELEESLAWFRKSAELDDANIAAKVYTAFALFMMGNMREGWIEYEKRLKLKELQDLNYTRPRWDGSPLEGKTVLLLREQGFGDNLQFVRYAQMVAECGGEVILLAQGSLLRLFKTVPGCSFVLEATPEPKYFHRYCPLMSLPYIFGTDENSIPANVPYIHADEADIETWRKRLEPYRGLKVGLVWRGNPEHNNDRFRSTSLAEMTRLLSIPGITFFSMVLNRPEFESTLPEGLVDITDGFGDYADTAAAIANLDLVISVDTSVCHLTGALGYPVWTMLPRAPDFRWGLKGTQSPWYPSMTLYRQEVLGDWSTVYDRMEADLKDLAAKR